MTYILLCFVLFRYFNVHEVLCLLEDEEAFESATVYIEPPQNDDQTDEDSADENEGGTYERSKGNETFQTSQDEMRAFLGILLVSGYSPVARRRMFWSHDDDVTNITISTAMTRDRFEEIMKFLHVSDNTKLDARTKFVPWSQCLTNDFCTTSFPARI